MLACLYRPSAVWPVPLEKRLNRYGIPLSDLPSHCLDAVDAAERSLARTLIVREGQAVAAIVAMADLDRIDPPDPASNNQDPLLALCGSCKHDAFVDSLSSDLDQTSLWHRPSRGAI